MDQPGEKRGEINGETDEHETQTQYKVNRRFTSSGGGVIIVMSKSEKRAPNRERGGRREKREVAE